MPAPLPPDFGKIKIGKGRRCMKHSNKKLQLFLNVTLSVFQSLGQSVRISLNI
jgi:hypothetical protein